MPFGGGGKSRALAVIAPLLPPPVFFFCRSLSAAAFFLHFHCCRRARYGASELHNVASVVGGIASQEAVKVIGMCRLFIELSSVGTLEGSIFSFV